MQDKGTSRPTHRVLHDAVARTVRAGTYDPLSPENTALIVARTSGSPRRHRLTLGDGLRDWNLVVARLAQYGDEAGEIIERFLEEPGRVRRIRYWLNRLRGAERFARFAHLRDVLSVPPRGLSGEHRSATEPVGGARDPLLEELKSEPPGRAKCEVRPIRNTRRSAKRFVLYVNGTLSGAAFSYQRIEAEFRRLGTRALRDGESDLFDAYARAYAEHDPRLGNRERGVHARRTAFTDLMKWQAAFAYVWVKEQRKRDAKRRAEGNASQVPPAYQWASDQLSRRPDFSSLGPIDRAMAAELLFRRHGREWRDRGLRDYLASDPTGGRLETFYKRYIRPRLSAVNRALDQRPK